MSTIKFTTPSECDVFAVHVGQGSAGDNIMSNVYGDPYPEDSTLIRRINYSTSAHGRVQYKPPDPNSAYIEDQVGVNKAPWELGVQFAAPGDWILTLLDDDSAYVCLTRKKGHRLDYIEYFGNAVHALTAETWAVPLGGPATINGIVIPEYGIAHKNTGEMKITDASLVVCLTERI